MAAREMTPTYREFVSIRKTAALPHGLAEMVIRELLDNLQSAKDAANEFECFRHKVPLVAAPHTVAMDIRLWTT